jgi:thiosulfate reductase cytochrome b subunit
MTTATTAASDIAPDAGARVPLIHPLWLRITHWLNALAVFIMIFSGWRIYNASPIFAFRFADPLTLGGWLGGALLWHFAAMWLLVVNGLAYLAFGLSSGRIRRQLLPVRFKQVLADFIAAMRGQLAHDDLRQYNAVQKLSYLFVIADSLLIVTSGLVVWKSVQFPLLNVLFGGYDTARKVHFFGMAGLAGFIVVHLILVVCVPRTLVAMIRGR